MSLPAVHPPVRIVSSCTYDTLACMIRRLNCTSFTDDVVEICGRLSQMSCSSAILPQVSRQLMRLTRSSMDVSRLCNALAAARVKSFHMRTTHRMMRLMSLKSPDEEFHDLSRCLLRLRCSESSSNQEVPRRWTPIGNGTFENGIYYLCGRLRENCILDTPADIADLCVSLRTLDLPDGTMKGLGEPSYCDNNWNT